MLTTLFWQCYDDLQLYSRVQITIVTCRVTFLKKVGWKLVFFFFFYLGRPKRHLKLLLGIYSQRKKLKISGGTDLPVLSNVRTGWYIWLRLTKVHLLPFWQLSLTWWVKSNFFHEVDIPISPWDTRYWQDVKFWNEDNFKKGFMYMSVQIATSVATTFWILHITLTFPFEQNTLIFTWTCFWTKKN